MSSATLIERVRSGETPEAVHAVSQKERVPAARLCRLIAAGKLVIPKNVNHGNCIPVAIGSGVTTKINANMGTSKAITELDTEMKKLHVAVHFGADTVMDLSTGGNLHEIRQAFIRHSPVPVGSVPVYEAASYAKNHFINLREKDFFDAVKAHACDGIDYMTIHAGVTKKSLDALRANTRIADIVSRGGGILAVWMSHHGKENPLYDGFDELIEIFHKYDATFSLGDSLRPGAIGDANDPAQFAELKILGELQQRALKAGVQSMIEGPGHIPLHLIVENVRMQKKLCHGAPFYVLGPLVTDIAPGYDHITSAIGAANAGMAGADFLCYVTPAEHLALPNVEQVKQGVIAYKIAAHAADIAKGLPHAMDWDDELSRARKALDWEKQYALSLDPETARRIREDALPRDFRACSMCDTLCPMLAMTQYFDKELPSPEKRKQKARQAVTTN